MDEYLSLPPTRQDLTQGQKPEGRLTISMDRESERIKEHNLLMDILLHFLMSMTLGFMHFAFIRVSEGILKVQIYMVNFLSEKWELFVCMCAKVCVLLNACAFVYVLLLLCIYCSASLHI